MAQLDPQAAVRGGRSAPSTPDAATTVTWRTGPHALIAALAVPAAIALLLYLRAAWLGLSWDDGPLTVDNPSLRSLEGLVRLWTEETWKASGLDEQTSYYRPIAMTSFWLVARISGSPAAHHVTNVLLHAANAALLARLLLVRLRAAPAVACVVASFWAAATANAEAVLWISGRFDVLVTTFLLVGFLANGGPRRWLTPLVFACALLTKEVALAWLPVLLVDDLALLRRSWRESWRRWALLVALAGVYLAMRRAVGIATGESVLHALSWFAAAYASIALRVATKLLVPVGLAPLRPLQVVPAVAVLAILALLVASLLVAARRSRAPESRARPVLVGLSWFAATLLPMAVIDPAEPVAGDRYGYAASVGLVLVVAGAIGALRGAAAARGALSAIALLAVVQCVTTELRVPAWQDRESIAASMASTAPDNAHAQYLLGYLALERRDLAAAEERLSRALALQRSWRTLDAMCVLELRRRALDAAERDCVEAASLQPTAPTIWVNLASVQVKGRRWSDALESADRAIALKPRYAEAHYLAGVSAANLGRLAVAASHVDEGLRASPGHAGLLRLKEQLASRRRAEP